MDHRTLVRALACGRIVIGGALTIAPGTAGAGWIGDTAYHPEVKVFTRAFGVRDLALGLGTFRALNTGEPARSWVVLGALCDAVDLAATTLAVGRLGPRRALPVMAVAGTAAVIGVLSADQVDA